MAAGPASRACPSPVSFISNALTQLCSLPPRPLPLPTTTSTHHTTSLTHTAVAKHHGTYNDYQIGDVVPRAVLDDACRTTKMPTKPLLAGRRRATTGISGECAFDFNVENIGWHYVWASSKHSTKVEHSLRTYVNVPPCVCVCVWCVVVCVVCDVVPW